MSYDLKELQRLEREASAAWATPGTFPNAALIVALRNAAAAGMLERMAKLETLLVACQRQSADDSVSGLICFGREVREALNALTTAEPRNRGDQGRVDDAVNAFRDQFVKKEPR